MRQVERESRAGIVGGVSRVESREGIVGEASRVESREGNSR